MTKKRTMLTGIWLTLLLTALCAMGVRAETYNFELKKYYRDSFESAVLTARNLNGQVMWTYETPEYAATELDNFTLITNEGYIYLVEHGFIKLLDFYTGEVLWTNPDFKGSPAQDCYTFSSSGKLYIGGYYGPDLYVIDREGNTICRVESLDPGSYWISGMWFYEGDYMRVIYDSNSHLFTFNVLDYFGRMDGLRQ